MTDTPNHDEQRSESTLIIPVSNPQSVDPEATPETSPVPTSVQIPPQTEFNPGSTQPAPILAQPLPETRAILQESPAQPPEVSTQALPVVRTSDSTAAETLMQSLPAIEQPVCENMSQSPKEKRGLSGCIWALAGAAGAVVLGGAAWFFLGDGSKMIRPEPDEPVQTSAPAEPTPVPEAETPTALRPYMEKARQGDATAMHMLAVMYYNGLNVRQNREEGLKWYRKAAEAGSVAAKKELKQIEAMSAK